MAKGLRAEGRQMKLRPYQEAAIEECRGHVARGSRRVLLVAPTGGGKTVIFAAIIASAAAKGRRALVLAHRRELVQQASNKLAACGVEHGIIQAGRPLALHHPVQVASVQTLARRAHIAGRFDLVVVDECHHVTEKNTYSKVIEWYPEARVLGVTATPWRLDGEGLADVFDAHTISTTPRELRDWGYLTPVGGWEYDAIDTGDVHIKGGDYAIGELGEAASQKKILGSVVRDWLDGAENKRTVVFACTVRHSQALVAEFQAAGVAAEHLDGTTPNEEREAILERLKSGETRVVSNCQVLTEGFDCPSLEVAVLARPTLSTALYLQMVGRILRPVCLDCGAASAWSEPACPECGSESIKRRARIHDHAGCLAAHGHPYSERSYDPHSTARVPRKKAEGERGRLEKCKRCGSVLSRVPCDSCGWAPSQAEVAEEAARRREIDEKEARSGKQGKESASDRAARWKRVFAGSEQKRLGFYIKMAQKHGPDKAAHVYHWFSGGLAFPAREWIEAARHVEAAGLELQ